MNDDQVAHTAIGVLTTENRKTWSRLRRALPEELNVDVKHTLRGTLRSVASPPPKSFLCSSTTFMGAWDGMEAIRFILH
ncbi:hypothetical protein JVT61DRAFT_9081 [Boletus reticuloceps]|uniref:Uncharacterized protein n=1 Tax=Boletus reticuloceps TaxID=495285 RepID=A0A8I3A680_9AGAM|nr:hypothetical protein JVT61DRAFT_9081 [Boletus reticuloceps]